MLVSLAQNEAIISPVSSTFAEDVPAPLEWLEDEFACFLNWAPEVFPSLSSWCAQHGSLTKARQAEQRIPGRISPPVRGFLSELRDPRLTALSGRTGIDPILLALAFDVTIRGLQYHRIIGPDTVYFAHPIRSRLLSSKVHSRHPLKIRWSWGSLIAQEVEEGRIENSPLRIMEIVADLRLRSLRAKATWYGLSPRRDRDAHDIVAAIAADAKLPAKLRSAVKKKLANWLAVAGIAAKAVEKGTGYPTSYLGIVLEAGALAVHEWSGDVPAFANSVGFCRGLLDWDGLFLDRASRSAPRRNKTRR